MSNRSLFQDLNDISTQSAAFKRLASTKRYSGARELLDVIYAEFSKLLSSEKKFIRNFRGQNFNGHLFELYLYASLKELSQISPFEIVRENEFPDFILKYTNGPSIHLEATSLNPTQHQDETSTVQNQQFLDMLINNNAKLLEKAEHIFPPKFINSLSKKFEDQKRINMQNTNSDPFIIAIQDYSQEFSMSYSMKGLIHGLYAYDEYIDGKPFFEKNYTDDISAILCTNQATITKFARMAKILGYNQDSVEIIRFGIDENLSEDGTLQYQGFIKNLKDENYREDWFEGMYMFHNPHAKISTPRDKFPTITHVYYHENENKLKYFTRPRQVLWSATHISERL